VKKQLIFTADRSRTLTLDELREFLKDASVTGYSGTAHATVETSKANGSKDEIRKIAVERRVW